MSEEKIKEGIESVDDKDLNIGSVEHDAEFNYEREVSENVDKEAEEKLKQAQGQIATTSQPKENDEIIQVKKIAEIDNVEDQIDKLTQIASQEGPKKAFKIARALNSNYMIDEMHDRMIDEEELRRALIEKGFIEKV